jgi:ribosomal subunit interface protein
MPIPLQVTFHGIDQSAAAEDYVRKKAEKLETLSQRIIDCRVSLEMPHRHGHHGQHYHVGIDLRVPGGEVVATHAPQQDRSYEDLFAAIDAAFDVVGRRLHDFVHRQRGDLKSHEPDR